MFFKGSFEGLSKGSIWILYGFRALGVWECSGGFGGLGTRVWVFVV